MSSPNNLPPLAADGVFAVSASSVIDAPREKVWGILTDFPSYKECRDSVLVDESEEILPDQTLAEGKYMLIAPVHLPPTMGKPGIFQKQSAFVKVVTVDPENCCLKWISIIGYPFLLRAERWQSLSVGDDGKTKYETIEVFSGMLAYLVKLFTQANLKLGFEAMAQELKRRAEATAEKRDGQTPLPSTTSTVIMGSFARLLVLAALAFTASASVVPRAGCDNPTEETQFLDAGNGQILTMKTTSCSGNQIAERTDDKRICGALCINSCSNAAGDLPPVTEDCAMLQNAIKILPGSQQGFPPSFGLQPGESKSLTFKTCTFTTINNGPSSVTQCWVDMGNAATRAGSACYPPVMPLHSMGLCTAPDGSWAVTTSHTPNT
ncbi:hypothetical protein EYR40_010383 [Pleurotus pulmonarius]|nr:hypothetical protein EYR40_010383 [Pleurotus pulmonarius]